MALLSLLKTKQTSVIEILKVFYNFSKISGLKLNKAKCEIAGMGKSGTERGKSGTLRHAMHQLKQINC